MPALNKNITVRLRADASNFNASIKAAGANAQQLADGMEQSGRKTSLLTTGLAAAGMAAGALGVAAIKTASDFDASMSGVQSVTRASAAEMDLLRQAAIDAGDDTIYSASEAAAGITELGKAGLSTTDILSGGLNGALDLAASEGIDVSEAAELMATALTQFGLSGDRATDVADALAAGAGSASGSARDLGFALSQAGTMAHTYGISMEETVGALSAFASAGMIGSDAGTSLRSMLQHLGNPTDEAKTLMDELGISVYDSSGHFVSLANLAGQLQTQMGGLSEEERNAAMATIFGADAVRAATQLYNQGAAGVEKWTKTVSQSGYAADMASTRTDNLQGDLEQLSGSFETLLINLGEGGQGPLRALVQTLDTLVDAFSSLPAPVQQTIVLGVAAVGWFTALHKALGPLNSSTSKFGKTLGQLIDPWQRVINATPQFVSGFQQIGQAVIGTNDSFTGLPGTLSRGQTAMSGFKSVARGLVSLMGGPWGIAFAVAGSALLEWAEQAQEAEAAADAVKSAMETTGNANEALLEQLQGMKVGEDWGVLGFIRRLDTGAEKVTDLLDQAGISMSEFIEAATGDGYALEKVNEQLDKFGNPMAVETMRDALGELATAYQDGTEASKDADEALSELNGTSETAADSTLTNADAMSESADAAEDYSDQVDSLIDSLFELEGVHVSAYEAQTQLQDSIQSLTDSFAENGNTLDINTEQGRANRDALSSLASQAMDTAQAILEEGAATGDMSGATEQARAALENARNAFVNAAIAGGMTQAEAEAMATQFGLTGGKADELAQQIQGVQDKHIDNKNFSINSNANSVLNDVIAIDQVQIHDKTFTVWQKNGGVSIKNGENGIWQTPVPGNAEGGLIGYVTGGLLNLANGDGYSGLIHGWGGKKADVMPIMASRGEFMQQASAVDYYGVDAMKALNERKIPREWLAGPQQVVAVAAPEVKSSSTTVVVDNQAVVDAIRQAVREMPGIIRKNTPVMGKRDAYRVAREAVNGR